MKHKQRQPRLRKRGLRQLAAGCLLAGAALGSHAQNQAPDTPQAPSSAATPQTVPQTAPVLTAAPSTGGGTIHGSVKAGTVPLPGVAITATNTLTGRKYATTTDIDGTYAMTIPKTGRYVVKAELAAFAPLTSEVRITAEAASQTAEFDLQLASRAAQAQAAGSNLAAGLANGLATALARGTQSLSVTGEGGLSDASTGNAASTPSLGGAGADTLGAGNDSVAVTGAQGQTNGLASLSEDDIRDRISQATDEARRRGGVSGDQIDVVVSLLGGIMGGPGGGGRGGPGGGRGSGGFRNFNPTTPHGSVFYQGGFSQLDAQAFSLTGIQTVKPNSYQNRFGVTFAGSPSIPGLIKASTKQFVFLNLTGQRNITPENLYATVPTQLERTGDFSESGPVVNGVQINPTLYDPTTNALTLPGQATNGTCAAALAGTIPVAACAGHVVPVVTQQAQNLLNYYPAPNVPGVSTRNYQNVTTQGTNTTSASARYVRNFGAGGFPGFGGGGGGRANRNAPATLRQNINASFSYSHNAADIRNFIPILGGKTASDGYGLSAGYTIGFGRLTNNASLTWNRSHTLQTNYFTYAPVDPATAAGIPIPSRFTAPAANGFYNGIPNIQLTSYSGFSEVQPRDGINQTISFSDFVAYSHKKHNIRFGLDIRRVHADQVGGNNVVGSFSFSGLSTESPAAQAATFNDLPSTTTQAPSGLSLADLEFGLPQQSKIQAGEYKTYLRENVYDGYAQDDWRATANVSLNYGLRYEYFGPYTEKNSRLANLDHNADFTVVDSVLPGGTGTFGGAYPTSLVNPDRTMFSPRFGVAWKPKFLKDTVVRAGYGINFNTGQYATFAQSLAFQPPFATTQNNVLSTAGNATGCNLVSPTNPATSPSTISLANGFACASKSIQNTYAVNKNYRVGHVQVYNLDIQKTLPHGTVVNIGYNGSKGGNLDIVTAPNSTATTVTTPNAQAFTYEDSVAESRLQQLVISARKRLEKGVSLQVIYQYGHSIDNASSIGGGTVSQVQNSQRLDLEEGNSSFDVRHKVTGNYVLELPFGPGRAFFNKGGVTSKILDGFGFSGNFTFATGTYFTPQYQNTTAQLASGGTYTLRPDRVFTQPIAGPKTQNVFFNPAAFTAPANGFGTASRNSIEGPGTVSYDAALSRSFSFGGIKSFEARITAVNAFNTVHFSSIDTTINSATYGQVVGTAQQRQITLLGRYRF